MIGRRKLLAAGLAVAAAFKSGLGWSRASQSQARVPVIDAHCHAGTGQAMTAPWTTFADPELILRRAEEAGIDQSIIFPINNPTYEKANKEVARIVERYPDKFIGFAKHDPETEKGQIERLLTYEIRELGLKGLKLHSIPTREVLDTVDALGVPILFHPPRVSDFHMIAAAYPQINFIMAHLGSFASRRLLASTFSY